MHRENGWWFVYKNRAQDRFLSHRRTMTLEVSTDEAQAIRERYPEILRLRHARRIFRLRKRGKHGSNFVLHVDTIEGLGAFTEIKARGSSDALHTEELLELATALGFTPADILEGSYLHIALQQAQNA